MTENNILKKNGRFVKIAIGIFVFVGLILFLGRKEWFPDFYNPKFMAMMAFISAFLIVLPRLIFKTNNDLKKQQSLNFLQAGLIIILALNGLGALGLFQLYRVGIQYDKLVHFIGPFIFIIIVSRFGFQWYKWSLKKSIILAAILVFIGGFIWELFEFFMDYLFRTQMLGQYGEFAFKDTIWDIIFNMFGIISGIVASIKLNGFLKRQDS